MPNFEKTVNSAEATATTHSLATEFSAETKLILDILPTCVPENYEFRVGQRMATLRAEILALQSHRHTLRPINRLPPEIFSTIFQLVKDDITCTWAYPLKLRLS
jgi:hypothetical protein